MKIIILAIFILSTILNGGVAYNQDKKGISSGYNWFVCGLLLCASLCYYLIHF